MELSVAIVNWNTREMLRQCLVSVTRELEETSSIGFEAEVIVVDNGSSDESAEMVRTEFPQVKLIEAGENIGFTRANNLAFRRSSGEFFLLLNSDTVVLRGAFAAMVDFLKNNPKAGAVGSRLLNADGTLQRSCSPFPTPVSELFDSLYLSKLFPRSRLFGAYAMSYWDFDSVREVDFAGGSCLMLRRSALNQIRSIVCDQHKSNSPRILNSESSRILSPLLRILSLSKDASTDSSTSSECGVGAPNITSSECVASVNPPPNDGPIDQGGPLDEGYFMYSEEADICYRLKKAGWKVFFLPEARVIHYGGQSSKLDVCRTSVELYKSKYRFMRKHYGLASALAYRGIVMLSSMIRLAAWMPGVLLSRNRCIYLERLSVQTKLLSWAVAKR
ncbi:MAG: glycosyltransferase family 2 protein [Armatimonadetes bacterium]|nr:glycosyltransferase family 2 protein [Armatimonadota bacterium]